MTLVSHSHSVDRELVGYCLAGYVKGRGVWLVHVVPQSTLYASLLGILSNMLVRYIQNITR